MIRKIITTNEFPPIPSRNYDWSACLEGWDLGEPIGYGSTEKEAIEELKELITKNQE